MSLNVILVQYLLSLVYFYMVRVNLLDLYLRVLFMLLKQNLIKQIIFYLQMFSTRFKLDFNFFICHKKTNKV